MDGMIKTATSNNVIYCEVTINPPLCTIVTSGCGGPRTHEPLFTRFSRYSPDLLVNIACCFLQEVVFSANGIAFNNRLYNKKEYSMLKGMGLNLQLNHWEWWQRPDSWEIAGVAINTQTNKQTMCTCKEGMKVGSGILIVHCFTSFSRNFHLYMETSICVGFQTVGQ
jgi:hypothetical protein